MTRLQDKKVIENLLRRDVYLRLYEIGDLDDFYFPHTTWYALGPAAAPEVMCMIYQPDDLPVLSALNDADPAALLRLLSEVMDQLPARFYCHLTPGLEPVFDPDFLLVHHGTHCKMKLTGNPDGAALLPPGFQPRPIESSMADEVSEFYARSYPANWFDRRMLETGKYLGVFDAARLVAIAGVHVYSAAYRVAVLGNITTDPGCRNRGLGTAVTALSCVELRRTADHIGLNVLASNAAAIRAYEKAGFVPHTTYEEYMVTRR